MKKTQATKVTREVINSVLENPMIPTEDVRNDSFTKLNVFLNWVFVGSKPRLLRKLVSAVFHLELPRLKYPVRLPHPYGVIVNGSAVLEENVTIFQHVTVGSKRLGRNSGTPTISRDVVIFPNAVIIGNVFVGQGAQVAPGAIVIEDVPAWSVVAGNPARVIATYSEKVSA